MMGTKVLSGYDISYALVHLKKCAMGPCSARSLSLNGHDVPNNTVNTLKNRHHLGKSHGCRVREDLDYK